MDFKKRNDFSGKAILMRHGYLLFFAPAIIATIIFGVYYYSSIYQSIAGNTVVDTTPPSTQIRSLTESVEEQHNLKAQNALEFAKKQTKNPFQE